MCLILKGIFRVYLICSLCPQYHQTSVTLYLSAASAINLEGELFKDLMKGYNKNVRPMEKNGDVTQVYVKMTLTNLISLVSGD